MLMCNTKKGRGFGWSHHVHFNKQDLHTLGCNPLTLSCNIFHFVCKCILLQSPSHKLCYKFELLSFYIHTVSSCLGELWTLLSPNSVVVSVAEKWHGQFLHTLSSWPLWWHPGKKSDHNQRLPITRNTWWRERIKRYWTPNYDMSQSIPVETFC